MRFAGQVPNISSFISKGPDYGAVADLGMKANSMERQTLNKAEAAVEAAGLDAMGQVRAAEHQARGIEASGQAQASAARSSGWSSMLGGIAGGIGSLNFGGGGSSSFNMSTPTSWGTNFPTSLPAGGGYGPGYGSFS